jgi:Tfp pilus tip-associated adhesin PilY1
LSPLAGAYSALQVVSSSSPSSPGGRQLTNGVTLAWDAGQMLADRSPDNRTVYCGYRASSGATLTRKDFTTANVATFASLLGDVNGDNAGLIDFIRGQGRDWKLGDIQHSNPVLLGPPNGDPTLMGTGYAAYASTWAARSKVLFVGANDGMLHCFDAGTGTELWGFIPYNLLPKLKNLSKRDAQTGLRYLSWDSFVDGSPAVADIQIGGAWKTILICGQGPGKGSSVGGGLNYYFALDVTDPQNPLPLWEITATTMGETWSVPAIGRTHYATAPWVAFMGSGYDNDPSRTVGNVFYCVRADTGATLKTFTVSNRNSASGIAKTYPDIYVAIPGSPTTLDLDNDGSVEYIYVGDLDGRLWRFNATSSSTGSWTFTAIYSDRLYYPIITKPAVWLDALTAGAPPRVYFGTGGADNAPSDRNYAFIALKDQTTPAVEWYIGDPTDLGLASSLDVGTFGVGEKVWADPIISDNIVYFSALKGSIENVNPCLNLADVGKFYARYLQTQSGGVMGATALKAAGNVATENLQLTSKSRRAVTLGERSQSGGTNKREVYIQEYDSGIERLEQGAGGFVKIKSWREVYKIIR